MEITTIIQTTLTVIGGATLLFRALLPIVKQTRFTWDDNIVTKGLKILTIISQAVSLNKSESKLEIKLKGSNW